MLLTERVLACYGRAAAAKRKAEGTRDRASQAGFLEMEERWLALARSLEASERLTGFIGDARARQDLDGVISSWNKGAEELFGYLAEEVVGRPVAVLIPPERLAEEYAILQRVRRGDRVDNFETVRRHKDGSMINVSLTISPIKGVEGKVVGAVRIARDITKHKRNEAQIVILAREAEHRAKNLLANLRAMVRLSKSRKADPPIAYLVGTPKGRLSKLEEALLKLPWQAVREGIDVKLLPRDQEVYVLAQSHARINKERAMRQRKLKWLWARLKQIAAMENLSREELLMKLGAARSKARAAWRLIDVEVAEKDATFTFALNRDKLRKTRRREGRYLLRTNLCDQDPAKLWKFYIQLVEIEAAFKNLKDDLQLRPIYHQLEHRIEAHIFVAFVAYCLHVTLRARLKPLAPGLTPRAVLDKLAAIQMLDVHFPTTDGRTLILSRYTELNADQKLLVKQLKRDLPSQPPPRITAPAGRPMRVVTQPV